LLVQVAEAESRIYEGIPLGEARFTMLAYVAKQRAQLERAFRTAIEDMRQLQKDRQTRQPQPAQAAKPAPAPAHASAKPPVPPPDYVMSEGAEARQVFCAPINPDTRW
jgi:hypothetical protein